MSAETTLTDRHLRLESVFNFRDLGGYRVAEGRSVGWGRLYRADGLHHLSAGDLDIVADLGLCTVIDLRTVAEVHERGRFPVDLHPVDHHHLPLIAETWHEDGRVQDPEAYLAARYVDMLEEGGSAVASAMAVLSRRASYPLVFHCAAGKDRTGVLAALVLGVLGVRDDDVVSDYTLSALGMLRMQAWLSEHSPENAEVMARQPVGWLAAPPAAMATLLAHVREVYGSPEAYLLGHGVAPSTIGAVRANLLC